VFSSSQYERTVREVLEPDAAPALRPSARPPSPTFTTETSLGLPTGAPAASRGGLMNVSLLARAASCSNSASNLSGHATASPGSPPALHPGLPTSEASGRRARPATYARPTSQIDSPSNERVGARGALWKTVVEAADYRETLAKRVRPRWFVPWDVFAVRVGDLTIEGTLTRLKEAREKRPPAESRYAEAACASNFAEALAKLFYAENRVSLQEVERIRRLGEIQELIAERFYARLRFGRIAAIAIAAVGLVALPKETVEKYSTLTYAAFGGIVFIVTGLALLVIALIARTPGRLAKRRARHTQLFKAVMVYLESLASRDAQPTSGRPFFNAPPRGSRPYR
jgi:hypothetical protein